MSAIPSSIPVDETQQVPCASDVNSAYLKLLPAVTKHAQIQFRRLRGIDRQDAIAEAQAAALLNLHLAHRNGKADRVTPATLAHYSVCHVRAGRHVGGSVDSTTDVMSAEAQRRGGFRVLGLRRNGDCVYDCLTDPTARVWRQVLLEDRSTPPPDQAAFRIDWSEFVGKQHDRTRTCMSLLAEGHKRCEVADRMGTTASALTQRMARVEREWDRFQGIETAKEVPVPDATAAAAVA